MPAHWLVRSQVKERMVEILSSTADVPVFRSFPPDWPDEAIWFGPTTGQLEYNVMGTNLPRDDRFSVVVVAHCHKPGNDPAEAEARAEEIASFVLLTFAEYVRLDDEASDEFSILDALVTTIEGPDSVPHENGEGWVAGLRLNVDIHLRITRET